MELSLTKVRRTRKNENVHERSLREKYYNRIEKLIKQVGWGGMRLRIWRKILSL